MTRDELIAQIKKKKSYLCVGLDTDVSKIPAHLRKSADPVFEFNKQIIDATYASAVAYKPNIAFYESQGPAGWESLQKTMDYIPGDIFTIADAKRGDLGNTASHYATTFFDLLKFDSVTLSPFMGKDSVQPFLDYKNKWVILLAHTSNPGSADFQLLKLASGRTLYQEVLVQAQTWATPQQMMFVVGATRADKMDEIRRLAPESFFLVPGIGAQGGDLELVSKAGMNNSCGLLVNSSRAILYASDGTDFTSAASAEAKKVQQEMAILLERFLPSV